MTELASSPRLPGSSRLRVLYARGKRARWWPLLAESPSMTAASVNLYRQGWVLPIARLLATVRSFRPQLVLTEYSGLRHLPLVPLCSALGLPLVAGIKGDPWLEAEDRMRHGRRRDRLKGRLHLWSSSKLLRQADLLLPLTAALERSVHEHLGTATPCRVVPIPWQEPAPHGPTASSAPFFLTVTHFNFRRKVAPLVDAAPRLAPILDDHGLDWLILGDGPFLEDCRRRLGRISARIRCLGFQQTAPYYRAARLFLYFSGLDGLPNALLEAALHRLPIVVHRGSPAAELIADGETGAIVDLDDPAQTSSTLRALATDTEQRSRLGAAAAAWVRTALAPETIASELEAALKAAVHQRYDTGS